MTIQKGMVVLCATFAFGVAVGAVIPVAQAQVTQCATDGAWEVREGHAAEGHNWYAVRFNRCTGETWVLGAEGGVADDKWFALPFEKSPPR